MQDQMDAPTQNIRDHLKLEGGKRLAMSTQFEPAGDQPTAIVQRVLPGQRGRVFCKLLRLLSARGLCRPVRHVYRKRKPN